MVKQGTPYGNSSLHLAPGVAFTNEEEVVFAAMLEGWTDAQVGERRNKRQSAESNVARAVRFAQGIMETVKPQTEILCCSHST